MIKIDCMKNWVNRWKIFLNFQINISNSCLSLYIVKSIFLERFYISFEQKTTKQKTFKTPKIRYKQMIDDNVIHNECLLKFNYDIIE